MPSLILCNRRSRIGSDDLYYPAILCCIYHFPCLFCAAYISYTATNSPNIYFGITRLILDALMILLYLMIARLSAKGTIVESEQRANMPKLLQTHLFFSILMCTNTTYGLHLYNTTHTLTPLLLSLSTLIFLFSICFFACCVVAGAPRQNLSTNDQDLPFNHEKSTLLSPVSTEIPMFFPETETDLEAQRPNSELYVSQYEQFERKCHNCCQCIRFSTCNLFGGHSTQHDAMSSVATIFSRLFYGDPDLVLTDIVAGYILLAAVQAYEDSEAIQDAMALENQSFHAPSPSQLHRTSENIPMAPLSSMTEEMYAFSERRRVSMERDRILSDTVVALATYSKFAVGIYGWLLALYTRPIPTFFHHMRCFRGGKRYIHGDNMLSSHQNTLLRVTGVQSHDVVFASFFNSVYRPAYCILLLHERKEVMLAIRGTLSLEDCLTDAIAYGISLDSVAEKYHCIGRGEYAHQGFLAAAEALYIELMELGVLDMLFNSKSNEFIAKERLNVCPVGRYASYRLIITGHSLGAGIATLLAILLKPKFPSLHCYAYSPPGCTVSVELAQECKSFVTAVVLGYDIVARTSIRSAEAMRDRVIDLIVRCKINKNAVLRQIVRWERTEDLLYTRPKTNKYESYQNLLREIQEREPMHDLTLPGRIVHLTKVGSTVSSKSDHTSYPLDISSDRTNPTARSKNRHPICPRHAKYHYKYAEYRQFREIRIARSMLNDHFPDRVHAALQHIASRLESKCHCT